MEALTGGNDDQRWTAARAAAAHPDAVSALAAALPRERESRVRGAIFNSLARIASPDSAAALLPYLRSDEASLRTGAIDALRAMPAALAPHLPGLLADPDPDVRLLSCELVREQPEAEANRLLAAVLEREPEANVCAAALEVASEIGGPDLLEALRRCEQRFAADPFLAFSIGVARERIEAQRAGSRE
jgi:HEAT repeat protein